MKIDYNSNKKELIDYLKTTSEFSDFNFSGSNINIFLDILARNAHKYGVYASMLHKESNPLTIQNDSSLKGFASRHSILVKNNSASMTTLTIKVKCIDTSINSIFVDMSTKFTGTNDIGDTITFTTIDEFTLYRKDNYYIGDVVVYEGELKNDYIEVNDNTDYYEIVDDSIDISTLSLQVKKSKSTNVGVYYNIADKNILPDALDNVFYIFLSNNNYKFYFGNNIYGKEPSVGEYIKITYVATNGIGNNTSNFKIVKKTGIIDKNSIYAYDNIIIDSELSSGAHKGINKKNLKTVLSNYSRIKSSVVTDDDYKTVILNNYPDISSIAVWGGEKNNYRKYGKIYISIKPKHGKHVSNTIKSNMKTLLSKNYSLVADNIVFVNPNYMTINITVIFNKNINAKNINTTDISTQLLKKSIEYDKDKMGKFDKTFNEKTYIEFISNDFIGAYSNLYIRKELVYNLELIFGNEHTYNFDFKNPLLTFKTDFFDVGGKDAYYMYDKDMDGVSDVNLYIDGKKEKKYGSIDLNSGMLTLNIPMGLAIKNLNLIATPADSSIETTFDRILQLGNINVEVK